MENYLYLLEVFVDTITFSLMVEKPPNPSDVLVTGEVGKSLKLDIFTMHQEDGLNSTTVKINSGKSILFPRHPNDLENKLHENPLRIVVLVKRQPVGEATLKWDKSFSELIQKSIGTYGVSGPVTMQEICVLQKNEKIVGDIKVIVKLSSFGTQVHTGYQMINPEQGKKRKYLIRGARGDTTFEFQKFDNGSSADMLPVSPLFTTQPSTTQAKEPIPQIPNLEDETISWMALFKSAVDPKSSALPDDFSIAISNMFRQPGQAQPPMLSSNTTFDIISIIERPEENKFMDLRIHGGSQGLIFELEPLEPSKKSLSESEPVTEESLTNDRIIQLLCKNKDCPAAKKFKEYGLGPLATVNGLGTLRNDIAPPVTYGVSQTYGVFDQYGPYGLFSRPKRPEDPFVPPNKNNDWMDTCWKPKRKEKKQKRKCCGEHPPLRLTGGGIYDTDNVKNPLHECKEVIDQFDEVLAKYKQALGPCGQATCPFAPNITKQTCKKICNPDECLNPEETMHLKLEGPAPTFARGENRFPACGSPKCAYAKYKLGLTDEDAAMELQYLPSPESGRCGHRKCPYPVEPNLPPIHWDCPDPLPKDRCKNPDCPYLPREIKCLNAVMNKGPCQNLNCPYAIPDPCESPNCPFGNKECPYYQPEEDSNSVCNNPDCPYAVQESVDRSACYPPSQEGTTCPFSMPCPNMMSTCSPFGNPILQAILLSYLQAATCGNPDLLKICFGGKECPFVAKKTTDECSAPKVCKKKPKKKRGGLTDCDNPNCPYQPQKPEPPGDVCKNPDCPYADKEELEEKSSTEFIQETRTDVDNAPCKKGTCRSQGGELECDDCGVCPCNDKPKKPKKEEKKCSPAGVCGVPCINPLQALMAYCLPFSVCNNSPYTAIEIDDLLQAEPPGGACKNPDCPNADKKELEQSSSTEFIQETRTDVDNAPCKKGTCKSQGGELECDDCGVCPCNDKTKKPKKEEKKCPPAGVYGVPCLNPLQALMAYCLPFSVCNDINCPYTAKEINDLLQTATCRMVGQPKDSQKEEPPKPDKKEGDGEDDITEGKDTECKVETRESLDLAPCTQRTCLSSGGKLQCEECPCSSGQPLVKTTKVGKKNRRRKGKYVYSIGDKYPGVQIGHRQCVMPGYNVPKTMGWLWNVFTPCMSLKPRRGWRPGAIGKLIAERIKRHREAQGLEMLRIKDLRSGKARFGDESESAVSVNVHPKPTLQIKKKDGCYWITMNPLKDPHTLVENECPYMDCTPMQFKIVKNKDKNNKEEDEYKTCYCGDDEENSSESSSDSELDIEFTPPAGIIHPERFKKKRNVTHEGTQYLAADWDIKSQKKKKKKDKKGKGKKKKGKGKKK